MAKQKKQDPNNVANLANHCPVDDCGKKAQRANFCNEHFTWFKEGLINRKGEKPNDFDKKFQYFSQKKTA